MTNTRDSIEKLINKIIHIKCDILDIGEKTGMTSYIDFIEPLEVSENIMKGVDKFSRKFIVFKATIYYENGLKQQTFTTFFQRYTDDRLLYHTCGHSGVLLFDTTGGASLIQFKLLDELFEKGSVILDIENIDQYNIANFQSTLIKNNFDILTNYPIKIELGHD